VLGGPKKGAQRGKVDFQEIISAVSARASIVIEKHNKQKGEGRKGKEKKGLCKGGEKEERIIHSTPGISVGPNVYGSQVGLSCLFK